MSKRKRKPKKKKSELKENLFTILGTITGIFTIFFGVFAIGTLINTHSLSATGKSLKGMLGISSAQVGECYQIVTYHSNPEDWENREELGDIVKITKIGKSKYRHFNYSNYGVGYTSDTNFRFFHEYYSRKVECPNETH